jgi:hypothetical protein
MRSQVLTLALVALLLAVCHSASKQTYAFPYNDSSAASPVDPTTNAYFQPVYDLGVLDANYSITVTISLPNLGSSAATALGNLIPAGLIFYYEDTSSGSIVMTPLQDTTGAAALVLPAPTAGTDVSYTTTFAITFAAGSSFKSAPVKLAAYDITALLATTAFLDYFTLEVTYYNSTGYSVSNPNPI